MHDLLLQLRELGEFGPSVNFKLESDRTDRIAGAVTCGLRNQREVIVTYSADSYDECITNLTAALRAYLKEENNV